MLFTRHKGETGEHDHQTGTLLDRGWRYDAEVWLFDTFVMHGQIGQLRRKVIEHSGFGVGQRLLAVGCGTGTLAIRASRLVGTEGYVAGIDPAPRQVARAQAKARRAGCDIDFRQAAIQALPFADESFDAVTSALMMHHLPGDLKDRGLAEIRRVLKPQGRLVVADFDTASDSDQQHDADDGSDPGRDNLSEVIARAGFGQATSSKISFGRTHHEWSGATIIIATKR